MFAIPIVFAAMARLLDGTLMEIKPNRVKHARAVARLERAKVRSVSGSSVVLEDATTITIGSVLRFMNERGKPSADSHGAARR
jgi:hypothetical protein